MTTQGPEVEIGNHPVETFLRLRGFVRSKNTEAESIEKQIGLRFPQLPIRIDLNHRVNRLALALKRRLGDSFAKVVDIHFQDGAAAFYLAEYNAFVVRGQKDAQGQFVELHENMHSMVYQLNQQLIHDSLSEAVNTLHELEKTGKVSNLNDQSLAYKFFDEGVCEWVATEVYFRNQGKTDPKSLMFVHLKTIQNKYAMLNMPRKHINELNLDLDTEEGRQLLLEGCYLVGHQFVFLAMQHLINEVGIETGDALKIMIANPPRTKDQIKDPKKYVAELVQREAS